MRLHALKGPLGLDSPIAGTVQECAALLWAHAWDFVE
jgi:hypothetical protein